MHFVNHSVDYEPQGRESQWQWHCNFATAIPLLSSVAVVLLTVWFLFN